MTEKGFHRPVTISEECRHFFFCITFRHISDMYALIGVDGFLKCYVRCLMFADMSYENIIGVNVMRRTRCDVSVCVVQFDSNLCRVSWKWQQKNIFKRLFLCGRFLRRKPFLKQCAERITIY